MKNIFEAASKLQIRFESSKGLLTVEDLWTLSLTSLDNIAKSVYKKLKETEELSFIKTKSNGDQILELKLEIVKHIIEEKQNEAEIARLKSEKSAQLETLKGLLADKKHESLKSLSEEELSAKISELQS